MVHLKQIFVVLIGAFCAHFAVCAEQSLESKYVGSQGCKQCHELEFSQWRTSDHFKAMQIASKKSVLGDFSNTLVEFHGVKTKFSIEDQLYYVTTEGKSGEAAKFKIKYTFGYYPLQQYLVELDDGHIQALNIAWDSRSKKEGGQNWYHLRKDEKISAEHPFFWTRHFQNWNNRCADCHSTNVIKNYNQQHHSYETTFSEINVACEACHGAAAEHVQLAKNGALTSNNTGFLATKSNHIRWEFKPGNPIAVPSSKHSNKEVNMCAQCHSLRTPLLEKNKSHDKTFLDSNRLQLINSPSYFSDGQIREEVFVLGSFLQSKMYEKGVTCGNCHNPHTGKVLAEDNALCTQCHDAKVFDSPAHHHHLKDSTAALCVNCHMPERTYMGVDNRRDHSFTIPRPKLSVDINVPNACTQCHAENTNSWASRKLKEWGGGAVNEHWSRLLFRAEQGDVLVTRALIDVIDKKKLPDLVNASLLASLSPMPSRVSVDGALKKLASTSSSSLLRRSAISALQSLPAQTRWQLLSPYLNDNSRSVRFQLAETLADVYPQLPVEQNTLLGQLIDEYRQSLALSLGSPATQLAIANLEIKLGNMLKAEQALQHALKIEPNYPSALINLADLYRELKRDIEIEPLLKKALAIAPDSSAAQHSYGLFLVRSKDYQKALPYFKKAFELEGGQPHFAYVYAVALDNQGKTEQAIQALINANKRWPNQYDILMALIHYLEKSNNTFSVYKYLSTLTAIAPNAPEVKRLVKKYSQ